MYKNSPNVCRGSLNASFKKVKLVMHKIILVVYSNLLKICLFCLWSCTILSLNNCILCMLHWILAYLLAFMYSCDISLCNEALNPRERVHPWQHNQRGYINMVHRNLTFYSFLCYFSFPVDRNVIECIFLYTQPITINTFIKR